MKLMIVVVLLLMTSCVSIAVYEDDYEAAIAKCSNLGGVERVSMANMRVTAICKDRSLISFDSLHEPR